VTREYSVYYIWGDSGMETDTQYAWMSRTFYLRMFNWGPAVTILWTAFLAYILLCVITYGILNVSVDTTIHNKQMNTTVLAFVYCVKVLLHVSTLLGHHQTIITWMSLATGLFINMDQDRWFINLRSACFTILTVNSFTVLTTVTRQQVHNSHSDYFQFQQL
jgi:hypothetical protein